MGVDELARVPSSRKAVADGESWSRGAVLTIFIGSSSETKFLAESISRHLNNLGDITCWDGDFFELGHGTLETLVLAVKKFDFAIFVLGADDDVRLRGQVGATPRANVMFELGLFMGALGSDRVFPMFGDEKELFIPSDFSGVTITKYVSKGLKRDDYESCLKATKSACEKIRHAIRKFRPPPPRAILTQRAVKSISSWLEIQQDEVNILVDASEAKALEDFEEACHEALARSKIYDAITKALGKPFGYYIQAIGTAKQNGQQKKMYLNCCMRPKLDRDRETPTYLQALLNNDPKEGATTEYLESDIRQLIGKPSFGHWLLNRALNPVPLALILDCSTKSEWDARIITDYDTPLAVEIDASRTSKDFKPALQRLKIGGFALPGLEDRFKSLRGLLNDRQENYMGTDIKSVLFIPVHGWPGITLQILTRERLAVDASVAETAPGPQGDGESPVRLTVDELVSIRLCGERIQRLLALKMRPAPTSREKASASQ
jgi:predicted nucleotide-binding protein